MGCERKIRYFYMLICIKFIIQPIMISNLLPLFLNLGTGEIVIIVFVVLLLFGGKKIPELMKGLGKGVRSFKQGMNEITDEINRPDDGKDGTKNS